MIDGWGYGLGIQVLTVPAKRGLPRRRSCGRLPKRQASWRSDRLAGPPGAEPTAPRRLRARAFRRDLASRRASWPAAHAHQQVVQLAEGPLAAPGCFHGAVARGGDQWSSASHRLKALGDRVEVANFMPRLFLQLIGSSRRSRSSTAGPLRDPGARSDGGLTQVLGPVAFFRDMRPATGSPVGGARAISDANLQLREHLEGVDAQAKGLQCRRVATVLHGGGLA